MTQRNTLAKIQKLALGLAFTGLLTLPQFGATQVYAQRAAKNNVAVNKSGSSARAALMNAATISLNEHIANEYGLTKVNIVFGADTEQYEANDNKMGLRGMGEIFAEGKTQGRITYDITFDASAGRVTNVYYHLLDYKK